MQDENLNGFNYQTVFSYTFNDSVSFYEHSVLTKSGNVPVME